MADGTVTRCEIEEIQDNRSFPATFPLSHYWAMEPNYFRTSLNAVLSLSASDFASMTERGRIKMREDAEDVNQPGHAYSVRDGIAYLEMTGPMTKRPNCLAEMFGGGAGASTMKITQALRMALSDDSVKSIIMVIDSGGGEVNGAFDLASYVAKVNKIKPVTAYIEDIGASAAYLVASQAGKVYANANAILGSIGVYQEIADTSKAAEASGVKVHIVKAGEQKAIGHPGTEVTEAQLAVVQTNVNKLHGLFLRAVNRGRGMDAKALSRVADGGIFIGSDGKRAGLVDGIITLDEVHSQMTALKPRRNAKGKNNMATEGQVQTMLDNAVGDEMEEMTVLDDDKITVASATVEPVQASSASTIISATSVPNINTDLLSAIFAAGITTSRQFADIRQMAIVGEEYRNALASQTERLAIVAFGPVDGPMMSANVNTANVSELRALGRQFQTIAQAKGLVSPGGERMGRESLAQEIAGGITVGEPDVINASSESNEGRVRQAKADSINNNRSNFNGTGLYSL